MSTNRHRLKNIEQLLNNLLQDLTPITKQISEASVKYLTLEQASKRTNLSKSTLRRAISSQKLRAVNLGSSRKALYRIKKTDLDAFMETNLGESSPLPEEPVFKPKSRKNHFS